MKIINKYHAGYCESGRVGSDKPDTEGEENEQQTEQGGKASRER